MEKLRFIAGSKIKQLIWRITWQVLKIYTHIYPMIQQFHFQMLTQGKQKWCLHKDLHTSVHSSLIHNSQNTLYVHQKKMG